MYKTSTELQPVVAEKPLERFFLPVFAAALLQMENPPFSHTNKTTQIRVVTLVLTAFAPNFKKIHEPA